jgi:hypothetical protein
MTKECIYCGSSDADSRDHVPPRALFPSPRPALITVPCCSSCNNSFSKDDTYFRDMLCFRQELAENEAVKQLLPLVIRSIGGDGREAYSGYIRSRFSQQIAFTPSNLWIGDQPTIKVDLARFHATMARIVVGLFYHETKTRLEESYEVRCFPLEYLESLGQPQFDWFLKTVIEPLQNNPFRNIGESVFKYRLSLSVEPNGSAWQLTFYEKYPVFCVTIPKGALGDLHFDDYDYPAVWRE